MDKRSTKRIKLSRPSQEKRDNDPPGDAIAPAAPGAVAQQPHVFPDDIFGEIIPSLDPFIICKMELTCKLFLEGSFWDHVHTLDLDALILPIVATLKEPATLLKFKNKFAAISERILRHHAKLFSVILQSNHHISHPFYERAYLPWLQQLAPKITKFSFNIESIQLAVRLPFLNHLNVGKLESLRLTLGPADHHPDEQEQEQDQRLGNFDLPAFFSNKFAQLRRLNINLSDSGRFIDPILIALTGATGNLESVTITTSYSYRGPPGFFWSARKVESAENLSKFCLHNKRALRRVKIGEADTNAVSDSSIPAALGLADVQMIKSWQAVDATCRDRFVVPLCGLYIDELSLWEYCVIANVSNERFKLEQIDELFQLCFPTTPNGKFEFALNSFTAMWRIFEFPTDVDYPDDIKRDNVTYMLDKVLKYIQEHRPDWVHTCMKPQRTLERLCNLIRETNRDLSPPPPLRYVTPRIIEQRELILTAVRAAVNARPTLVNTRNVDILQILFEETAWINPDTKINLDYIFHEEAEESVWFGGYTVRRTIVEKLLLNPTLLESILPLTGDTALTSQAHILTALIKVYTVVPKEYGACIRYIFDTQRQHPEKYECFSILMNTAHTDSALSIILQHQHALLRPFMPALLAVAEVDSSVARTFFEYVHSAEKYNAIAFAFVADQGKPQPDCGLTEAQLRTVRNWAWKTSLHEASTESKLRSAVAALLSCFQLIPKTVADFALKPDSKADVKTRLSKAKARKVLAEIFSAASSDKFDQGGSLSDGE